MQPEAFETVVCQCNVEVVQQTSWTNGSPGRGYSFVAESIKRMEGVRFGIGRWILTSRPLREMMLALRNEIFGLREKNTDLTTFLSEAREKLAVQEAEMNRLKMLLEEKMIAETRLEGLLEEITQAAGLKNKLAKFFKSAVTSAVSCWFPLGNPKGK
ncbi:hypothetical protein E2562_037897 [Oryza meyeriana var. granulata]|uniref:Uncharacterized protein n=1 Tax=Oryza meyeriana var. granulata TaxID=110450 RepID=A0A6G1E950_9ORYZ|nr:hypothetical protein E2562_037897 [Oryza meyeriana var. granulata]